MVTTTKKKLVLFLTSTMLEGKHLESHWAHLTTIEESLCINVAFFQTSSSRICWHSSQYTCEI